MKKLYLLLIIPLLFFMVTVQTPYAYKEIPIQFESTIPNGTIVQNITGIIVSTNKSLPISFEKVSEGWLILIDNEGLYPWDHADFNTGTDWSMQIESTLLQYSKFEIIHYKAYGVAPGVYYPHSIYLDINFLSPVVIEFELDVAPSDWHLNYNYDGYGRLWQYSSIAENETQFIIHDNLETNLVLLEEINQLEGEIFALNTQMLSLYTLEQLNAQKLATYNSLLIELHAYGFDAEGTRPDDTSFSYIEGFNAEGGGFFDLFNAVMVPFQLLGIELVPGIYLGYIALIPIVFGLIALLFAIRGGKK